MLQQNQILRTLSAAQSRVPLEQVLSDKSLDNRTAIARRVCQHFRFFDARGRQQVAGCAKALSKLKARGEIVLPAPLNNHATGAWPRLLSVPVPAPAGLPKSVDGIEELSLVVVARIIHINAKSMFEGRLIGFVSS